MKCPFCGRHMEKITLASSEKELFYYRCNRCPNETEILTENNQSFGDNFPIFKKSDYTLKNWEYKKFRKISELKEEHRQIINEMHEKYGYITDSDIADILIEIYEHNKSCKNTKKKRKSKND